MACGVIKECRRCKREFTCVSTSRKAYCGKCRNPKWKEEWHKEHPWYKHYQSARKRCTAPRYGYVGKIIFEMTPDEFKYLWFRDKAWLLKHSSIDRIDNTKGYRLDNCRFIEWSENARLGALLNSGKKRRKRCPRK